MVLANINDDFVNKYITVTQVAGLENVTGARVRQWLKQGRIKNAIKMGRDWIIPNNYKIVRLANGRPKKYIGD
jgi:hypothetical protein